MKVSEVMTQNVMTCRETDTLESVAAMMKELNVGDIPVVNENENLVGIITDRDIAVRAVAIGANPSEAQVGDFMTPSPVSVSPDTNVEDAADLMADVQVRRLPVVEDNRVVGVVSLGDLAVDVGEVELVAETLERISEPTR
ncbi:MAG: CBS domain-containing protein [Armatimonadota bacterium]